MDIFERILKASELYDDNRPGLNDGGMLVKPSADGSRPGYRNDKLPRFITKDPNNQSKPYRVKVKKSKVNPEPFSGNFSSLREAKSVASKFAAGKPGGSDKPELIKNAQSVVNDYNKVVDNAIANNNLKGIQYFESYVKEKFPNTSKQNQILRQVYKRKMDYRDLTEVRKDVAKNLVKEALQKDEIISANSIYQLLGKKYSRQLSSPVQQIVNKGLKNQVKLKVDNAIQKIVDEDLIIEKSFKDTISKIIGRSMFGPPSTTGWKQFVNKNPFYKENKKLLDYAFSAGAKSNRAPEMSLSEIMEDAKYKIGGGVTFSGKQTQFSGLRRYIMDYAKSHWHRNNYDGNPEKSLIEFYDKNGKPIKWKSGLKIPIGEVQFKIPSESDIMWSYSGKPKGSVSITGPVADASGIFDEVTSTYKVIKEISDAPVTNPITGKKTTYNNLVKDIYKKYGYEGKNIFGLDIDHFKGVREHPFKNLRAMDRRLNISLGAIDRTFDNRNLKAKLKNELLGDLSKTKGSNYVENLKKYFVNQATNVLDKTASARLESRSPYYQAVKNVYEQPNLPKSQKILLQKSYQRAINLVASLGGDDCARGFRSQGGRIGLQDGTPNVDVCFKKGIDRIKKGGTDFTQAEANNFSRLTKGLRAVGASNIMKFGVLPEALFEGALVADKMVSEGDSFMQGIRNSYLSIPFQAMGAMKTYEEGRKDEILAAAPESQRGKVLDVMSMQDTLKKRNELAQDSFGLKKQIEDTDRISDGSFGYVSDSQDLQKRLSDKRMDLQDLYRGDATRAERMLTSSPLDLKIKDQLSMDAYNQAVEKADALRAANIKVAPGTGFGVDTQIKKRMQDEGILKADDVNQYLQYMGDTYGTGYTPLSLGRLFSMFGIQNPKFGFDETGKYNQERGINDVLNYMKMQNIADAGGVANLASGGIAGAKSGPAPESGPTPHGLPNLFKRVRNY